MDKYECEVVLERSCLLGECPVWDARLGRICWIDILTGEINSFYPETQQQVTQKINQVIGSIALTKSGGLIAALNNSFAMIDEKENKIKPLAQTGTALAGDRLNDGKCDAAGRFWAGTMSESGAPSGFLYSLEKDLAISTRLAAIRCSNGLAWSRDNKKFYHIDTPTRQVMVYDYDLTTGNITNGRAGIHIPDQEGYPDGMTIDSDGMLWIALWGGGKIARYNPWDGEKLYEFILPAMQITSCVFGGSNFEDLYITSACVGLSAREFNKAPLAGSLFVIKNSGFTGVPAFEFGY